MKKIMLVLTSVIAAGVLLFGLLYAFDRYERKKLIEEYSIPPVPTSIEEYYDVIVYSGEPEGVAAAVSAARNGAKTLLIEERAELGGLFTYGMLNFLDFPKGSEGHTVTTGIYKEWKKMIGNDVAFGIEEGKATFYKLIKEEENITFLPQTKVTDVIVENNILKGVQLSNVHGEQSVTATSFIDASQDADLAVMAGAPYFLGAADIGNPDRKMAVTLMIHLHDVDWLGVFKAVRQKTFGHARMNLTAAWGFDDLHTAYQPVNPNTRLRGLNLVKDRDDYYINALQIFGINGLDSASKAEAIEIGIAETEHIVEYLRENFPGFENAKIASYPTELYVRETRHIEAEYQVSMRDVWTHQNHDDYIAYGAYPVDVQAQTPQDYGYVLSAPAHYGIPFRSIVPKEIDGLLVVNRSAGYSSLAAGSARIVPTGMGVAEAAGVAAALKLEKSETFRHLSQSPAFAEEIRGVLKKQGAFVKKLETDYPYKGEWYDEAIQTLINKGLIVGGYSNDVQPDKEIMAIEFMNTIAATIERTSGAAAKADATFLWEHYAEVQAAEQLLTVDQIVYAIGHIFGQEPTVEGLVTAGILTEQTVQKLQEAEGKLLRQHYFAVVADLIHYLEANR